VSVALPKNVKPLAWLAEQLGIGESTCYRLASTGELAKFGVFKVGHQYRCSVPAAHRAIHGAGTEPGAS